MLNCVTILFSLLILSSSVGPTAYGKSDLFASYQIVFSSNFMQFTSPNAAETFVYTPNLPDTGVISVNAVLSSISNTAIGDLGYTVSVSSNNNTLASSYMLVFHALSTSTFQTMAFSILVITNLASTFLQAVSYTIPSSPTLAPTAPTQTTITITVPTTVNISGSSFSEIFLSSVKLHQTGADQFQFGIFSSVSNTNFSATYAVGGMLNNYVDEMTVVVLFCDMNIFSGRSNDVIQHITTDFTQANFGLSVNYGPNYNEKCLVGWWNIKLNSSNGILIIMNNNNGISLASNSIAAGQSKTVCVAKSQACNAFLPACATCANNLECSTCSNNSYAINATSGCALCMTFVVGCATCSNNATCLTCSAPTYYGTPSNNSCLNCTQYLSSCEICTNITICVSCFVGYGNTSPTNCSLCSGLIPNCIRCTSNTNCTACATGFFFSSPILCSTCSSAIMYCASCRNSTFCTGCSLNFILSPSSLACVCAVGFRLVTGSCSNVTGCISSYFFGTAPICLACDTANYFTMINSVCVCQTGFTVVGNSQVCTQICGDGILIHQACDDGNTINGDGCSSACTIQPTYNCTNGSLSSKSQCFRVGTISFTLSSVQRTIGSYEAQLTLDVSPSYPQLSFMDWHSYTTFTPHTSLALASATYSSGVLVLLFSYNQAVEGTTISLTLGFDHQLSNSQSNQMQIKMIGANAPLTMDSYSLAQDTIAYALAVTSLIIFGISLYFHKMIGLQTIQVFQALYFTRLYLYPVCIPELSKLAFSNGFNNLFTDLHRDSTLSLIFIRYSFSAQFLLNLSFNLSLIAISLMLAAICKLIAFISEKQRVKYAAFTIPHQQNMARRQRMREAHRFFMERMVFPSIVMSLFVCYFSSMALLQDEAPVYTVFPIIVNMLNPVFMLVVTTYLIVQLNSSWEKKQTDIEEGYRQDYVGKHLAYYLVLIISMMSTVSYFFGIYIVIALQFGYLLGLTYCRPYQHWLHNVSIAINIFISLACTFFIMLTEVLNLSDSLVHVGIYVVEALLTVVLILGIIRTFIHHKLRSIIAKEAELQQKINYEAKKNQRQAEKIRIVELERIKENINRNNAVQSIENFEKRNLQNMKERLKREFRGKKEPDPM